MKCFQSLHTTGMYLESLYHCQPAAEIRRPFMDALDMALGANSHIQLFTLVHDGTIAYWHDARSSVQARVRGCTKQGRIRTLSLLFLVLLL